MRRKTKRTEENSAGTRCGATAGKTEPEYEEKLGGIPKRQQARNSEKKQARTPRESRPGTPRKSRPGRRGRAGTDAEEEQARTPRKSRHGRRGRAGTDAEEEQARTPRKSRHGRRELRESKPELLRDSDAPLKKNRIGHLKKKTQDQASDGQRRRETGKAQAGVPKDSGAADRQDGAGTGKPSEPQHFSSKSSASIHAGNFSLKAA